MKRLLEVRKFLGLTQKAMAEVLQIGQNTYSMIENGKISLTDKNKNILSEKLKINPYWLTSGVGSMFLDNRSCPPPPTSVSTSSTPSATISGIPYYSSLISDITQSETLYELAVQHYEFIINFPPLQDCSFYRPVWGESMSPRFNPGDIIACKQVASKNYIQYGETYLCVLNIDGQKFETLRILRRDTDHSNQIILRAVNSDFDESVVTLDMILELYVVKGKIERYL